mmetsp:Transcript_33610/g.84957  ORF Transcript_33610/g.84957 Transcript_33610/m.84957 type:complete len:236 (+) Transcript_33610:2967-3674(+)
MPPETPLHRKSGSCASRWARVRRERWLSRTSKGDGCRWCLSLAFCSEATKSCLSSTEASLPTRPSRHPACRFTSAPGLNLKRMPSLGPDRRRRMRVARIWQRRRRLPRSFRWRGTRSSQAVPSRCMWTFSGICLTWSNKTRPSCTAPGPPQTRLPPSHPRCSSHSTQTLRSSSSSLCTGGSLRRCRGGCSSPQRRAKACACSSEGCFPCLRARLRCSRSSRRLACQTSARSPPRG